MATLREREQSTVGSDDLSEFSRPVESVGREDHKPIHELLVNKATREVFVDGGDKSVRFRNRVYLNILLSLSESVERGLTNEEISGVVRDKGNSYYAKPGWDYIANLRGRLEPDPTNPQIIITDRTTGETRYHLEATVIIIDTPAAMGVVADAIAKGDDLVEIDPQERYSLRKVIEGDLESFGEFYERYANEVFKYIDFRVRNMHVAQDLTSKVFLSALDAIKMGHYTMRVPFAAWIKRIAHNLTANYFRDSQKQPNVYLDNIVSRSEEEDMAGSIDRQKVVTRVRGALEKLPPLYQIVLHKYFWEERSFAEIAEELGIKTPGAAKALAYRAKLKLKEVLSQMEEAA